MLPQLSYRGKKCKVADIILVLKLEGDEGKGMLKRNSRGKFEEKGEVMTIR